MFDFHAKTVLVTGGGAGIGRAIAEAFGAAGARVAVAEIDPVRAGELRQGLQGAGVDALVVQADGARHGIGRQRSWPLSTSASAPLTCW